MTTIITDEYAHRKFSSPSSEPMPAAGPIKIELVWTNVFTRWPCTICGGTTEKEAVLAEGPGGIRVCERCLKCRNFAEHLQENARWHDEEAKRLRDLRDMVNRLEIPTFEEWIEEGYRHEAWSAGSSVEEVRAKREEAEREWKAKRARWDAMTEEERRKESERIDQSREFPF
jgi:hypothetical protein